MLNRSSVAVVGGRHILERAVFAKTLSSREPARCLYSQKAPVDVLETMHLKNHKAHEDIAASLVPKDADKPKADEQRPGRAIPTATSFHDIFIPTKANWPPKSFKPRQTDGTQSSAGRRDERPRAPRTPNDEGLPTSQSADNIRRPRPSHTGLASRPSREGWTPRPQGAGQPQGQRRVQGEGQWQGQRPPYQGQHQAGPNDRRPREAQGDGKAKRPWVPQEEWNARRGRKGSNGEATKREGNDDEHPVVNYHNSDVKVQTDFDDLFNPKSLPTLSYTPSPTKKVSAEVSDSTKTATVAEATSLPPAETADTRVPTWAVDIIAARSQLYIEQNGGDYSRYGKVYDDIVTESENTLSSLGPVRFAELYINKHPNARLDKRKQAVGIVKNLINRVTRSPKAAA